MPNLRDIFQSSAAMPINAEGLAIFLILLHNYRVTALGEPGEFVSAVYNSFYSLATTARVNLFTFTFGFLCCSITIR